MQISLPLSERFQLITVYWIPGCRYLQRNTYLRNIFTATLQRFYGRAWLSLKKIPILRHVHSCVHFKICERFSNYLKHLLRAT